ncbi:carbohydrate sulfotransferase 1-like isoform X1 [Ptychodera flava]|uniref:carbohydrate sulfotransferase 1-like isoform X1 n=1 Tax=Ptychodera flava TaxID=63121 RepID=UPI00396AA1B3
MVRMTSLCVVILSLLLGVTMFTCKIRELLINPVANTHQAPMELCSDIDIRSLKIGTMASKNNSVHVIIFASKRTGSSFVGELFNQNKEFFYMFEPIEVYTHAVMEGRLSNYLFDSKSIDTLHSIFTCDFHALPEEWQLNVQTNCNFGKAFSVTEVCKDRQTTNKFPKRKRQIRKTLTEVCKSRRHIAVKIIRIYDINLLRSLLVDSKLNVKIVHLVRDPRAVFNSRNTLNMINKDFIRRGSEDEILQYCRDLEKNVLVVQNSQDVFRNRYTILRYEDVAKYTIQEMQKLYKFLDLNEDDDIVSGLSGDVSLGKSPKFSTRKNSKYVVDDWRKQITIDDTFTVQRKCSHAMQLLGYLNVTDYDQLRDLDLELTVNFDEIHL